jgi:hypothetical protein
MPRGPNKKTPTTTPACGAPAATTSRRSERSDGSSSESIRNLG